MNHRLRQELLSMQEEDQRVLRELMDAGELREQEYHPRMRAVHERNNARIKAIVGEYGWPGVALVGKEGAKAAWLMVQHAVLDTAFMERALPLLEEAVKNGDAEGWCLAYLQDRVLTMAGKPQIYGTQHDFDENGIAFPLPIAEPGKVDLLRRDIGLEPLSEATKRIQDRYRPVINKSG
ncbi:hypothetical protein CAI21_16620 [Alkalilimnicola ehrlichii]|uniref:Uncharacterized protein n=1 Tax=Alkalilimnicola ehrlichii TaxID=351052 RepID=A0A3E0WL77_9GAMM|nr:DUF6624 domain-containing protein [Alkalilimnicola ehrlichii]RFA26587.1 hypothetical protein CAI21_16620 [Alkalilimnicola ehrlichii]RFA32911.1 hypothetical protein CAL65_18370 [Alkalilimnicola ehrlichii]